MTLISGTTSPANGHLHPNIRSVSVFAARMGVKECRVMVVVGCCPFIDQQYLKQTILPRGRKSPNHDNKMPRRNQIKYNIASHSAVSPSERPPCPVLQELLLISSSWRRPPPIDLCARNAIVQCCCCSDTANKSQRAEAKRPNDQKPPNRTSLCCLGVTVPSTHRWRQQQLRPSLCSAHLGAEKVKRF